MAAKTQPITDKTIRAAAMAQGFADAARPDLFEEVKAGTYKVSTYLVGCVPGAS